MSGHRRSLTAAAFVAIFVAVALVIPATAYASTTPTAAAPDQAAQASSGQAGSNLGNAQPITGTVSGSLASTAADDWWVIYPATLGGAVAIQANNTSGASSVCSGLFVSLDASGGSNSSITNTDLSASRSTQLAGSRSNSDRYFVEVMASGGCNPPAGQPATYTLTLQTGGGGTPPTPATGSIAAGTSIGSAWPPLQGHTSYTGTIASGSSDEWYSLYKNPDTNPATIRIENTTTANTAPCAELFVSLDSNNGSSASITNSDLPDNSAITLPVPAEVSTDPSGLYSIELTDVGCPAGGTTYRIEPEPATEWNNPPKVPDGSVAAGTSIGNATPPLQGHTSYTGTIASGTTEDWYSLYKNPDTNPATIRIENTTTANTAPCSELFVSLDSNNGSSASITNSDLSDNSAITLPVPAEVSTNPSGLYYIELTDVGCPAGGTTYQIDPEPATEWNNPSPLQSDTMPIGSSFATAGGPLAGGVDYFSSVASANSQNWDEFVDNGTASQVFITIQNTSYSQSTCKSLFVNVESSTGLSIDNTDLSDDSATTYTIDTVGTYYLEVTDNGCPPGGSAPPTYQVSLSPTNGITPRAQTITFTTTPPNSPATAGTYQVGAKASSGLPVALSIDPSATTICSISGSTSGSTVTFNASGTCIIDANQSGNRTYLPAPQVEQTINVGGSTRQPQTITFATTPPKNPPVGSTYPVRANATSGLPVTLSIDATSGITCTIAGSTGSTVTFRNPGVCIIDANQAGNSTWLPAPQVQQVIALPVNLTTHGTTSGAVVQSNPKVFLIFWGPDYATNPSPANTAVMNQAKALFQGLPGSSYEQILAQYGVKGVSYGGSWADPTKPPQTNAAGLNAAIASVTSAAIKANGWKVVASQAQFIVFPQSDTLTFPSGRPDSCAYHYFLPNKYVYSVIPWFGQLQFQSCASTYGDGVTADGMTVAASHEYFEAATDPYLTGWYAGGVTGEISDLCVGIPNHASVTFPTGSVMVQYQWSKAASRCVISG